MDRDRVIGRENAMPWHLPEDLRRFRRITMGKPVVMGRRTHEAIGRPLDGRRNIVVSRRRGLVLPGCEVAGSLREALALAADAPELMVIGGGMLFAEALPLADRLYLTLLDESFPGDTRFPSIEPDVWREVGRERCEGEGIVHPHTYLVLERAGPACERG